jgi:hypothetical protein
MGHRQIGVELECPLKGTNGLVVIEAINVAQPLIKELLRRGIFG